MHDVIKKHCSMLKLGSRIVENYTQIEADTHEEFLARLLSMEVEARKVNRKNRLLKQANFDVVKTFENYIFDGIEIPPDLSIEMLKSAGFIEDKENLILYGAVGTGKSHMATAIGVEACNRYKKVQFFRTAALVNKLLDAKSNGSLGRFMQQLNTLDLLVCDEWGYIPFEREGAQLLFQVISDCYERRSLIITTNLKFSEWNGIFYGEKLTSAIIDRIVHHSYLLVFNGPSHRLLNSKLRQRQ
jgi:DNA replication protein DnaC